MSEESISLEETNRIRLSLGLKPIPGAGDEPAKASVGSESLTLDETNKLRVSLGMKPIAAGGSPAAVGEASDRGGQKDEQLESSLASMRSKLNRKRKSTLGKTLLDDAREGEEGVDDWLSSLGRSVRKKSKKKSRVTMPDETPAMTGFKIGHNAGELQQLGEDSILTLKESSILDESDKLESESLVQQARLNNELEKTLNSRRFNEDGSEKSRLQLAKEEEEEEGTNELTVENEVIQLGSVNKAPEDVKHSTRITFDLSEDEQGEVEDDYAEAKPIKMKKLLKRKSKSRSRQRDRTDEEGDHILRSVELVNEDLDFQDDLDLQSTLSLKRQQRQKKRQKLMTPEELAREIEEERASKMEVDEESSGVVIGENTEFLSSLKADLLAETTPEATKGDETIEEIPAADAIEDTEAIEEAQQEAEPQGPDFSGGLASTLSFLQSKNVVKVKTKQEIESERQNEQLRKQIVLNPDDDKHTIEAKLRNYKPQVSVKYHDEYGRELSQKEAYKQLSHQFHGKAPNKSKIAKKQRLVEEENKRKQSEKLLDEEKKANDGLRIQ